MTQVDKCCDMILLAQGLPSRSRSWDCRCFTPPMKTPIFMGEKEFPGIRRHVVEIFLYWWMFEIDRIGRFSNSGVIRRVHPQPAHPDTPVLIQQY